MREADRAVARSASSTSDPLALFSPLVRSWFADTYREPTAAQAEAWQAISRGDHALVIAPTGSGKTLAAFLWSLDRLIRRSSPGGRVLYVSPLRALAVDIERNLRGPLGEIRRRARAWGIPAPDISLGVRTGDTPPSQRRALVRRPPDILITTPESLFLLLTSRAQEALRGVDVVIVDEVHALADNKRGAHLALSLERLEMVTDAPVQRIGLSATVRPVETVAEFLGGDRPVRVVNPPASKEFDVRVVVPVPDMTTPPPPPEPLDDEHRDADGYPARTTLWPHLVTRLADAIEAHRSTIVFTNSRRLAERLTAQLNRLAVRRGNSGEVARAHHGSVSREQRRLTEEMLKNGRIPAVVATSSLELGIDMGAVDLVAQVEPPPSVSAAIQRFGRAGHQLGEISRGIVFPKHRSQLVPAAVIVDRMRRGEIETVRIPENPLDVLAQHVVAMAATAPRHPDELFRVVRRAAPYRRLTRTMFDSVVDLLLGRYASPHLASLRPRLILDEPTGTVSASREAARIALTNAGTIPDRGQYAVFLAGAEKPSRVGELDEEMVYESRVGTVFTLGSSSWRIVDIGTDRVLVVPAPGAPAIPPFWHGDAVGRPLELGRAIGATLRTLADADPGAAAAWLRGAGLDEFAVGNTLRYLAEQRAAAGALPDDRTVVVETFRDEVGDWRFVVHSPFGARVHAPWAMLLGRRIRERFGLDAAVMHSDDGIVARLPHSATPPPADLVLVDPDDIASLLRGEILGSALFAARFRECAARALLLPRRFPNRRTPLWQQRQRAAQLLDVAVDLPDFPIVAEAVREVWQEVFDVPGLRDIQRDLASGRMRLVGVSTAAPSPFARSLLFGYLANFLYENDAPPVERKLHALALDSALLTQLLSEQDFRDVLDDEVVADLERARADDGPPPPTLPEAVAYYAARHGPFRSADIAEWLGVPVDAVSPVLREYAAAGRLLTSADGSWCDADVFAALRRRTLAKLRADVEPVARSVFARFLPTWQHIAVPLQGIDGLYTVIDQLRGAPIPASLLESGVLAARVEDYRPEMLDELTTSGAVTWTGWRGSTDDGWIVLTPADEAARLLPEPRPVEEPLQRRIVDVLGEAGALFFRDLADRLRFTDDSRLAAALWDLVFAGWLTNDTLAALRNRLGGRRYHPRGPLLPRRLGPPEAAGRWSLAPTEDSADRPQAIVHALLDRHGVVARPTVASEQSAGGFSELYPTLATWESAGRCRRGYFVAGLGGAQFASASAVRALREASRRHGAPQALVLAAADPANPYGAALPWPKDAGRATRRPGAFVVLVDGVPLLYIERGGRTASLIGDPTEDAVRIAAAALAEAARKQRTGRLHLQHLNGRPIWATEAGEILREAGFLPTPQGLRLPA